MVSIITYMHDTTILTQCQYKNYNPVFSVKSGLGMQGEKPIDKMASRDRSVIRVAQFPPAPEGKAP